MWKDPIVEEIHKVREKILEECASKGQTLGEHFLEYQKRFKGRLVSRKPRLISKRSA